MNSETAPGGTAPALGEQLEEHVRLFGACYGAGAPPRLFFSPGRVNLFGGHLDYSGGPVMPAAIDRGTFIAVRPRSDRRIRMASTLDERGLEFDLDEAPTERLGRWVDYPLGVLVDLLVRRRVGGRDSGLSGIEILFGGNLSVGAGLSSSASICVGTAFMLDHLWDLGLDPDDRVQSALRAERGFVGVQCGIMDPYAVGLARPGHVLWLDCKDATWEHLPLDFTRVSILVANTGVKRELAASEFNRRVEQCARAFELLAPHAPGATCLRDITAEVFEAHGSSLPEDERRRAQHVVEEVARTFQARRALEAGDLDTMGTLMTAAHGSLRDLYAVSCPELDALVDAASGCEGAFGARLTGAGFGGCAVVLTRSGAEEAVSGRLTEVFRSQFGRAPAIEVFGGDEGPREL